MNEEKTLRHMLDIQRFVHNQHLQSLLQEVGKKYGLADIPGELSDDEMELFAAGDPSSMDKKKNREVWQDDR